MEKTEYEAQVETADEVDDLLDVACKLCKVEMDSLLDTDEIKLDLKKFKKDNELTHVTLVNDPIFIVNKKNGKLNNPNGFLTYIQKLFKSQWLNKILDKGIVPIVVKTESFKTLDEVVKFLKEQKEKVYLYKIAGYKSNPNLFLMRYNTLNNNTIKIVEYANRLIPAETKKDIPSELLEQLKEFYDTSFWDYDWPKNIEQIFAEDKKLLGEVQFAILKRYINITGGDWIRLNIKQKQKIFKTYVKLESKFKKQVMKQVKYVHEGNKYLKEFGE